MPSFPRSAAGSPSLRLIILPSLPSLPVYLGPRSRSRALSVVDLLLRRADLIRLTVTREEGTEAASHAAMLYMPQLTPITRK